MEPRPCPGQPMPWKPKSHRPAGARSERERKRDYDRYRGSSSARGYNSVWRKIRNAKMKEQPLCEPCQVIGRTTLATEVDHITPHRGDWALFFSPKNLQSICKPCHSRKTATEDSRFASREGGSKVYTLSPPKPPAPFRVCGGEIESKKGK